MAIQRILSMNYTNRFLFIDLMLKVNKAKIMYSTKMKEKLKYPRTPDHHLPNICQNKNVLNMKR